VQRLYDSRFGDKDVNDIRTTSSSGPGARFDSPKRVVLLIDEIDKADIEFPNDLLHELDQMRFTSTRRADEVVAKERPSSSSRRNAEKELPDAFLRRCVFHFIDFPRPSLMKEIVRVHHPKIEESLVEAGARDVLRAPQHDGLRKRPSTSELDGLDRACSSAPA
jgi:MoxR-like ATPase